MIIIKVHETRWGVCTAVKCFVVRPYAIWAWIWVSGGPGGALPSAASCRAATGPRKRQLCKACGAVTRTPHINPCCALLVRRALISNCAACVCTRVYVGHSAVPMSGPWPPSEARSPLSQSLSFRVAPQLVVRSPPWCGLGDWVSTPPRSTADAETCGARAV